jgi:serine protease AprX
MAAKRIYKKRSGSTASEAAYASPPAQPDERSAAIESLAGLLNSLDAATATSLLQLVREQLASLKPAPVPAQMPVSTTAPPTVGVGSSAGVGSGFDVGSGVAGGVTGGGGGGGSASGGGSGGSDDRNGMPKTFDPRDLDHSIIAIPLAEAMDAVINNKPVPKGVRYYGGGTTGGGTESQSKAVKFPVIIDLNLDYPGGRAHARHRVYDLLVRVLNNVDHAVRTLSDAVPAHLRDTSAQYVFADLYAEEIRELVRIDNGWHTGDADLPPGQSVTLRQKKTRSHTPRSVYRIWPSHSVRALLTHSIATIKGDAAAATFGASGRGIVWAVMDSGIDGSHRHFKTFNNLGELPSGVSHMDFTGGVSPQPLRDVFGHGTHVAGIIAGEFKARREATATEPAIAEAKTLTYVRDEKGQPSQDTGTNVSEIRGVAPQCKLVSYKVLDDEGHNDDVRNIIAALEHVGNVNEHGLNIRIQGVNLSLGYPFEPRWFACGHSPLCQVIDRLVRSGVVVVTAAGNSGYAYVQSVLAGVWAQGAPLSINDPGNAETAITVGSTHRDEPYRYGASYFSSKGPTGDGRTKPDLLAPGEKIVSCASFDWSQYAPRTDSPPADMSATPARPEYREESGTSMAAPHVSGAVAAFLSIRREFIGRPEVIKDIFLKSACDLGRDRYLQGRGLLDLMRALQSV